MRDRIDTLTDALADVLSGKPMRRLPADSERRRMQARKVTTLRQIDAMDGGLYDAELAASLEKIGIRILRGEKVGPADVAALTRLSISKSPRVSHIARSILISIDAMKLEVAHVH